MKNALITGANRGIGLEFARQLKDQGYYVIGCCRNPEQAEELKHFADEMIKLDVVKDEDIEELQKHLNNGPIDLLINNAGTTGEPGVTAGNVERDNFLRVLNVNCVSVIKLCDALLPNVAASQDKNIIAISSRVGSIADNDSGRSYAYRSSKAALNCVMRSFAIDVEVMGINVMLMHPGWVKTALGGPEALIDAETSVTGMLNQAEKYLASSRGDKLHRFDGGVVPW